MFEAERVWQGRTRIFARALRYQYTISHAPQVPPSFTGIAIDDLTVSIGSALPHAVLEDANGHRIGVLLGIAVGPDGLVDGPTYRLSTDCTAPDFLARFEAFVIDCAGRFAVVLSYRNHQRLYTDPVGMIGAVYDPDEGRVAASLLLALNRPVTPNPRFDADRVAQGASKYALFHTPDARVRRMNPNCYLDLKSFRETRFWPRSQPFERQDGDSFGLYEEIHARTRFNIRELTRAYRCALPISGGQDSRLILSFAKDSLGNVDQVFSHINNYATRRDAAIGQELCRALGRPHEAHDKRHFAARHTDIRKAERMAHLSCGYRVPLAKEVVTGAVNGLDEGSVVLRGHQTDILRAVFVFRPKPEWRDPDWQIERLLIVPRNEFSGDVAARFREEFMQWQGSLPPVAMEKAADFMFLELYYPSTVGVSFPAAWRNFYLSPFNSRRLIGLSLSFDEAYRRASSPVFDLIELYAPELSAVPFDFEAPSAIHDITDVSSHAEITRARREATQQRLSRLGGSSGLRDIAS